MSKSTPNPIPMLDLINQADASSNRRFNVTIHIPFCAGGTPDDPKVIRAWIEKNIGSTNQELISRLVAETMIELGVQDSDDPDNPNPLDPAVIEQQAIDKVARDMKLNRFKRDENGLYYEDRHMKACIKEAVSILWPKRQDWGPSRKGTKGYWAEHVFVETKRLYLGVTEPTGVQQGFVHAWKVHAPKYEEYVEDAKVTFTVKEDAGNYIKPEEWAQMWAKAQDIGIGAGRSQGYGQFKVVSWEEI